MSLSFSYDEATDILTIEGMRYSGALFRGLAGIQTGRWFKVLERNDGVITIRQAPPDADLEPPKLTVVTGTLKAPGWTREGVRAMFGELPEESQNKIFPCSFPGCGAADGSKCRHWPRA